MACPRADRRRCSRSLPPPRPRGVAIWGRRGRPDAECKRWDRDRLRLGFDQFDGDGDFQASSSSIGGMLSIGSGLTRRLTGGTERSAGAPPRAAWCRKARLDRASPYDVRRHVSTALSPARARDSHGGLQGRALERFGPWSPRRSRNGETEGRRSPDALAHSWTKSRVSGAGIETV